MELIKKTGHILSNIYVMVWRCIINSMRTSDILVSTIILPILILLIGVGLFGSAIDTGSMTYINFVIPGILVTCISYGAANNAVRINYDLTKGIIDRFRSMPIAKSSFLTGHVLASTLLNALSIILTIFVAFLLGFETNAGIAEWFSIVGLLFLYTIALTWVSVVLGLIAKGPEGAQAFGFIFTFLPFFSSAFIPTEHMHVVLRVFAKNQPMSPVIQTIRSLFMNLALGNTAIIAILWCVGLIFVFYIMAMFLFKRITAY